MAGVKLRFERFCQASDLANKAEERQVIMLLYCIGEKSEDIFNSFGLTAHDAKKFKTVMKKFDNHFVIKRNTIFERAKFNLRKQEHDETVEAFITALHKLSETWEFGLLRDELIRDRIVVGIKDTKLSKKLQLDKDPMLDKAITMVRQLEQVRQQDILRGATSTLNDINAISSRKTAAKKQPQYNKSKPMPRGGHSQPCKWCGCTPSHDRQKCQAGDATCRGCGKHGHFEKVCKSAHQKVIRAVDASVALDTPANTLFVDALIGPEPSDNWHAEVSISNVTVKFRLDTGADATVLPIEIFNQQSLCNMPLSAADKMLCGLNRAKLDVIGYFTAALQWKNKSSTQNAYVLRDVH